MNDFKKIPLSFLSILVGLFSVPAICYGALQYFYPNQPDIVYSKQGNHYVVWNKLTNTTYYTEYVSKERNSDSDGLTVNVLVLRNYFEPQTEIMNNIPVTYSSAVLHETINCQNQKITDENIFVYSKNDAKGNLLRAIIGSDYEPIQATPGSVAERKVFELCSYGA